MQLASLVVTTVVLVSAAHAQAPVVVKSIEAPSWGSAVHLVEEVRIGVLDGDENYMLGNVSSVAVGEKGITIIADGQGPVIRVFDAAGKFVRKIGRNGEGPGEYRSIGGLRTFRDGRIIVWDNRLQRLNTYTAAGAYIANVRVPSGLFSSDLLHVDNGGHIYVKTVTRIDPGTRKWEYGIVHVSPTLKVLDTVAVPSNPFPTAFSLATPSGFDKPFSREVIVNMTSTGALVVGDNTNYAFELRKKGAPTVRVERKFTPVALNSVEAAEWRAWVSYMDDQRRNDPEAAKRPTPAPVVIPDRKPAFHYITSDADGRIWVQRYTKASTRPGTARKAGDKNPIRTQLEQPTYDVFEPTGKFLGTVVLPWNSAFEDAVGMQLWLTVTGEDGDESVVRYRIEKGE